MILTVHPFGLIIVIIINVFLCWKYADWKNWELYYPTIIYLMLGNISYDLLTYQIPLWSYQVKSFSHDTTNLFVILFLHPCTVLIFLTYYPKLIKKHVAYILLWIGIYSLAEYLSVVLGWFSYSNGWALGSTIVFNAITFPLLYLHYKKPLWAWTISLVLVVMFIYIFEIPFNSVR